jgi:hypothetical protein
MNEIPMMVRIVDHYGSPVTHDIPTNTVLHLTPGRVQLEWIDWYGASELALVQEMVEP